RRGKLQCSDCVHFHPRSLVGQKKTSKRERPHCENLSDSTFFNARLANFVNHRMEIAKIANRNPGACDYMHHNVFLRLSPIVPFLKIPYNQDFKKMTRHKLIRQNYC
ncbi:unnamed protein product, partial [Allacma fusca]